MGSSAKPPTFKGNHTYRESLKSDGFQRSAMKMKEPGNPGSGSTNVPCEKKVVSLSTLFPPTEGLPTFSHGPSMDAAAWAIARFGAHPEQPDVIM